MQQFVNEEARSKAELYRLLGSLFFEAPAEKVLRELEGIRNFPIEETAIEIAEDFHGLFAHNTVPNCESFYVYPLGDKPRHWGTTTEEVRLFYQEAGLVIDEEMPVIPDHISAELFFMSWLVENEFLDEQEEFLEMHLSKWVPVFCDEVRDYAKTDFYKRVAILLKELVSSDYEDPGGV